MTVTTRKQAGNGQGKTRVLRDPKTVERENRDRFVRVAPPRVDRALHALDLIENTAGSGYVYKPDEAQRIVGVLRDKVDAIEAKFLGQRRSGRAPFTL